MIDRDYARYLVVVFIEGGLEPGDMRKRLITSFP